MNTIEMSLKRSFDFTFSLLGLLFSFPLIIACWIIATIETKSNGFFFHKRIGLHGKTFPIIKIKTMYNTQNIRSSVTVANSTAITRSGRFFRKYKLDELPQLYNVLKGDMSFVGPRPEVSEYINTLKPEERILLDIRPGITGPATLKYHNEEELLAKEADPETFNREVIWPDKIRINLDYCKNYSFKKDLTYIFRTVVKKYAWDAGGSVAFIHGRRSEDRQ